MDIFNDYLTRLNKILTILEASWIISHCEIFYPYLIFAGRHMLIRILAATIPPFIHAVYFKSSERFCLIAM